MDIFSYIGLCVVILAVTLGVTWVAGWTTDDHDFILSWIMTCILYAVTVTLLLMEIHRR